MYGNKKLSYNLVIELTKLCKFHKTNDILRKNGFFVYERNRKIFNKAFSVPVDFFKMKKMIPNVEGKTRKCIYKHRL